MPALDMLKRPRLYGFVMACIGVLFLSAGLTAVVAEALIRESGQVRGEINRAVRDQCGKLRGIQREGGAVDPEALATHNACRAGVVERLGPLPSPKLWRDVLDISRPAAGYSILLLVVLEIGRWRWFRNDD